MMVSGEKITVKNRSSVGFQCLNLLNLKADPGRGWIR